MNPQLPQIVRHRLSWTLLVCLLLLTLALSACGGSSSSTPSSSSSTSSSSSSNTTAAQSVMVKETKTAGQPDVYMCDPTSISIKKGDSVSFTNETDEIQNFDQGDESQAGIALKLTLNQSSTVTFNTTGTFNLKSEKGATLSVTVQ